MTDLKKPKAGATAPRAFVSYSWTTPEQEERVLQIATRLRSDGVDVVLDKWDLKEGHDAHAFMERMVTDKTINKVVILSDGEYARKADEREKGVGTETQIISKDVYGKVTQEKFIPVLMERVGGKACLPAFLGSRKYIDFSTQQQYLENYDQLLRAIFERPLYVKPALGKRPTHLDRDERLGEHVRPLVEEHVSLLIRGNMVGASLVFQRLLDKILEAIDALVPAEIPAGKHVDEVVREKLPYFLPYRDDYVDALLDFTAVHTNEADYTPVHEFVEQMLRRQPRQPREEKGKDGVIVAGLELLLYTIAVLLKKGRYGAATSLLTNPFLISRPVERHISVRLWDFSFYPSGLEEDWQARESKSSRRISVLADILKERATHKKIGFSELAQAELVVYIRATVSGHRWYPRLLIFRDDYGAMEMFARARSGTVLAKMLPVLGVATKYELEEKLKAGLKGDGLNFTNGFPGFPQSLETWLDLEHLGTLP